MKNRRARSPTSSELSSRHATSYEPLALRLRRPVVVGGLALGWLLLASATARGQTVGAPGHAEIQGARVEKIESVRDASGRVVQAVAPFWERFAPPRFLTPEAAAAKERVESGRGFPTTKQAITPLFPTEEAPGGPKPHSRFLQEGIGGAALPEPGLPFQGVGFNGFRPPDPTIATGPSNLLVATNGTINTFGKDGTLLASQTLSQFFAPLGTPASDGPFDPHAMYDQYINRFWFISASKNTTALRSSLLVGVSNTSDATGSWTMWALDATLNGSTNSGLWCDYPEVGIDAQAIYLTCNMFTFPTSTSKPSFQYAKLRVMTKGQFMSNTSGPFWWDFSPLMEGGTRSFTIVPAHMYGATASDGEFLIDAHGGGGFGSALEVWHVTNPQNCCIAGDQIGPNLAQATQPVARFDAPPGASQPGTATKIETNDTELLYAIWQRGLLSTGQNVLAPNATNAAAAFTELDVSGFPTIKTLNDWPLWAPGYDYYYPAADVLSNGNKFMVFSASNPTLFAGAYYVQIPASSICHTCVQGNVVTTLKAGQSTYVRLDNSQRNRWGDYLGASTDPSGLSVCLHGEFAVATPNTWATEVGCQISSCPVRRNDFDGDGKTDIAVWRPSMGTWWIIPSSNPGAVIAQQWGASTDVPIGRPVGMSIPSGASEPAGPSKFR